MIKTLMALLGFVFLMFLGLFFFSLIDQELAKEERNECMKWKKWSQELRSDIFFLAPWQKEQCDSIGIKIDAPIRSEKI